MANRPVANVRRQHRYIARPCRFPCLVSLATAILAFATFGAALFVGVRFGGAVGASAAAAATVGGVLFGARSYASPSDEAFLVQAYLMVATWGFFMVTLFPAVLAARWALRAPPARGVPLLLVVTGVWGFFLYVMLVGGLAWELFGRCLPPMFVFEGECETRAG